MSTTLEELAASYANSPEVYHRLVSSLVVVVAAWLIRTATLAAVNRSTDDLRLRYGWKKGTAYATFAVAVLFIANIWLAGLAQLGTFLGLVSAGVAIALKDPLTNVAGWMFIIWRKPFAVGDRIEVGGHMGDVIDVRIFQFSLLEVGGRIQAEQSTGRLLHVPNSVVFSQPLANATMDFPFVWNEIGVLVTFESDWRRARELIASICERRCAVFADEARGYLEKTTRKWFIVYSKLEPIVYTAVLDSGVLLTARFLCPPRQRRSTEDGVWSDILDAFAGCDDVDFAYPTTRFYDNAAEGKPGTRPSS